MNISIFSKTIQDSFDTHTYGTNPSELYDPISYIMALGGKRLRPMLTLTGASMFTENWQKAIKPAMAVEVFHNFTLLHDDIMDKAPIRRGKPTVHEKWSDSVAILSGDVMLVKAYELMMDIEPKLMRQALIGFNKTAAEVCEGQQLDMNFETLETVSKTDYINMIRLKTSVLLGYSLFLGALIGGANNDNCSKLYEIGVNAGLGFQLMDDILDVYGDPEKFGKQVGGDIISNKKTYLLLDALEKAKGEKANKLNYWLEAKNFDNKQKVAEVTSLYNDLNVRQSAEQIMNSYFDNSFNMINTLALPAEKKNDLIYFLQELTKRDK
jgi:geranylgeranyl diphosphate synthase, type II